MTELTIAPPELTPVGSEARQHDIAAMSNSEVLGEAHNFNQRYQDRNYFPSIEEQEFLKSIAHSIEISDEGAISYSLRGEKVRSAEARTFLDNVINMEREAVDPTYERKAHGTMKQDVAEGALSDFGGYIRDEYALGPKIKRKTAEAAAKVAYTAQYLGKAALKGTVLVAQTGATVAVQTSKAALEASKFAGRHAKKATIKTAKKTGKGAEKLTRKVDSKGNAALVGFMDAAIPITERKNTISWRAGYMGRVILEKMTAARPEMAKTDKEDETAETNSRVYSPEEIFDAPEWQRFFYDAREFPEHVLKHGRSGALNVRPASSWDEDWRWEE